MKVAMFLGYFFFSIAMMMLYVRIYMMITPYDDREKLRAATRVSPESIPLLASMIGFTMPLVTASVYGSNLLDFAMWAGIAGVVQLAVYQIMFRVKGITTDTYGGALFYGVAMLCAGAINAASLVP